MSMFAHVSLDHSPSALVPISGHFKTRVMAIYFTKHEAIFYPIVFFPKVITMRRFGRPGQITDTGNEDERADRRYLRN